MEIFVGDRLVDINKSSEISVNEAISTYCLLNTQTNYPGISKLTDELTNKGQTKFNFKSWIKTNKKQIENVLNKATKENLHSFFNADIDIDIKLRLNWDKIENEITSKEIEYFLDKLIFIKKERDKETTGILLLYPFSKDIVNELLNNFITKHIISIPSSFYIPVERIGLHSFYHELLAIRTAAFHNRNNIGMLNEIMKSAYSRPVADYISWLGNLYKSKTKNDFQEEVKEIEEIINGKYIIDDEGSIFYLSNKDGKKVYLHTTQAAIKNMFGLHSYLKYNAQIGDVLFIEEPYIGLNDEKRNKLDAVISKMVNKDIKVFIVNQ